MSEATNDSKVEAPQKTFLIVYRHLGPGFPPAIQALYELPPELLERLERDGAKVEWRKKLLQSLSNQMADQHPEFETAAYYAAEFLLDDLGEFADLDKVFPPIEEIAPSRET